MNKGGDHLTIEQIESLMDTRSREGSRPDQGTVLEDARLHLVLCLACQKLLAAELEAQSNLRNLVSKGEDVQGVGCPPQSTLYSLAGGMLSAQQSEAALKHIGECDGCSFNFRRAVADLESEQTPEESALIGLLETGKVEWQESFAKVLAGSTTRSVQPPIAGVAIKSTNRSLAARPRWSYALAPAAIVMFSAIIAVKVWHTRPSYAQELLARAYTERRTLEIRLPGARHGPLRVTRGPQPSNIDRPTSLLEAEQVIGRQLIAQPESAVWLEAKMRADLLDGNCDAAVQGAKKLFDNAPESSSTFSDLGMAYFCRAENSGRALDYHNAYEAFSKSLLSVPNNPVVLFNRAIVSERLELYNSALNDWKTYLNLGADADWQAEARERMNEVQEKLQRQKNQSKASFDNPAELIAELSSADSERISNLDSRIESYQAVAISQWIPQLTSSRIIGSGTRDSFERALRLLAAHSESHHDDRWLTDFLSERSLSSESPGAQWLAKAIQSSTNGDQESAIRFAATAEREFQKERNYAGRMRASFQHVYSNRLAAHAKECYEGAERLRVDLAGRNYTWLEIQSRLELAACAAEVSKIEESIVGSQTALKLAEQGKYGNLQLRATVFAADLLPDCEARLELLRKGLTEFWSKPYEPMRGYSLYAAMDTTAADLHLWFVDEAAIRDGLRLIEDDPDKSLRGLERTRLARALLAEGNTSEANQTAIEANALLSGSASPALYADSLIDLADSFVANGRYRDALALLSTAQPHLQQLSQDFVLEKYYVTRANALLGEGQESLAEEALIRAFGLAERSRSSIARETDRLSWSQPLEPVYRSLALLELRKDARRSFQAWESFKGQPATSAMEDPVGSISDWQPKLPSFPSWLRDGAVLLSYGAFPEGVAVWIYDGREVQSLWLPGSGVHVASLARQFHENCSNPDSELSTVSTEGHELYELLVKPAIGWIHGRTKIIVETDNALESIPFEALLDGDGQYVGDSFEIEYSAGLFFLNENQRPQVIARASRALIVGESFGDQGAGLNGLPDARGEAREVAARFDSPVLLLDGEAQLARIINELPNAQVFHFAGHAIESGRFSGLLLASPQNEGGPRFLDAHYFSTSKFRDARVVVFSACSTANGSGEGLNDRDSLTRTAISAGVSNVLASRWIVDSAATREWMRSFYDRAVNGDLVSSAAKQARIKIRTTKEWRHPFFWASFSVFV